VSPRARALIRALRQQMPAIERVSTDPVDPNVGKAETAAPNESMPLDRQSLWTSAVAHAAATSAPEPPRMRSESRRALFDESQAEPTPLRPVPSYRAVESVLPVASHAQPREQHEAPSRGERRPAASAGQDTAAAMALTARLDLGAPMDAARIVEAPEPRAIPNEAANAASIIRSMHWQHRNGVGTAVVQLDPGYLGEVRVALRVEGHIVTATLHAESAEVRAWMHANEGALRQGLTAQGLSLDTLIIAEEAAVAERTSPDGRGQSEREAERPRRPRPPARNNEGRTFEIVV
jgi:flagellar hook-length control protein FliK